MEQRHVEIKQMEMPEAEKSQFVQQTMSSWWVTSVIALVKTVGPEKALEVLGPMMYNLGKDHAIKGEMNKMVEGSDAPALASLIHMFEETMGIKGEIIEVGEERVAKINTSCPLSECPPEICHLIGCYAQGTAKVVAPEYTFVLEEAMTKGDSECRWVVRKK